MVKRREDMKNEVGRCFFSTLSRDGGCFSGFLQQQGVLPCVQAWITTSLLSSFK